MNKSELSTKEKEGVVMGFVINILLIAFILAVFIQPFLERLFGPRY